jgi:NSS family neurotransmitter:Na+ symporter
MIMNSNDNITFASRFGFICAAIGMAVGTGNIWRFPRVAAANGGGAFLVALTVAIFVWAIPLLMAEMVIARKTRLGTVGAIRDFMGRKFTWIGAWLGFAGLAIMFYYSVVMGWTVKYFTLSLTGTLTRGDVDTVAIWNTFTTTPSQTIFFHFVSMLIGAVVIYKGVTEGIEKVTKVMVPALFILLAITAIRAITLPGAIEGIKYLFTPNLEHLASGKTWLEAFTQAAWSTGAGWALLMTYAVYTKKEEDIGVNCFLVGFGDTLAALIAGMAVLPTIFALAPTVEYAHEALGAGNTGLTFIYLTALFSKMPGGAIIAPIFFLAMAFAALSSLLSMIEVGVLNLQDAGWERGKATLFVCGFGFLLGVPSAYSLNFLDNQDWVWGVALLISGLLVSIAIMKYGVEKARMEEINHKWSDMYIGRWWSICIQLFPLMFAVVFGWWVWQSIGWYPDSWWNPLEVFSPGTMFVQWAIAIAIFIGFNNWLADWIKKGNAPGGIQHTISGDTTIKEGK